MYVPLYLSPFLLFFVFFSCHYRPMLITQLRRSLVLSCHRFQTSLLWTCQTLFLEIRYIRSTYTCTCAPVRTVRMCQKKECLKGKVRWSTCKYNNFAIYHCRSKYIRTCIRTYSIYTVGMHRTQLCVGLIPALTNK